MTKGNQAVNGLVRSRWLFGGLLMALLLVAANYKLILGRAFPHWDAADYFGPQFGLVADHIKAHHLLMWNPWCAAGAPDLAEPEFGVTSPIVLAVAFMAPTTQSGFVTYWMLIWIGGALGMFLLAKHLGAPLWGAVVAALGFASSGFYTGHAEHTSSLYSLSLLPFIIWRLDASLMQQRVWFAVQAGAIYGLSTLGGYPQFTILTGLFLPLWTAGRLFFRSSGDAQRKPIRYRMKIALLSVVVVLVLGGTISTPIYLGFGAHARGFSDRTGPRTREEALTSNIFPAVAFTTISSPYLTLLNMNPGAIWPVTDVAMSNIYMGSGIIVLSVFALMRRNAWRWWIALLCVSFACCSVGYQLPVRGWLYDFVIPTRYFRNPALFTAYVIFLLAVLAALGAKDLAASIKPRERNILLLVSIVLAGGAIAAFKIIVHIAHRRLPGFRFANDHMLFVWLGLVLFAFLFRERLFPARFLASFFFVLAGFDSVSTLQISNLTLYTEANAEWWDAINSGNRSLDLTNLGRQLYPPQSIGTYPNNRNISLRIPTFQSYVTLKNRFYDAILADSQIRQLAVGADRFCFSSKPAWLKLDNADFLRFTARTHELGVPILVLHTPDAMQSLNATDTAAASSGRDITPAAVCSRVSVFDLAYKPNSLTFLYTANQSGWLLVTDRWAPGWNVRVNGELRPLIGGDFLFRAVHVDPGPNRIEFTYKPVGFIPLAVLSWSVLALIAVVDLGGLIRSFRQQKSPIPVAHPA